MKKRKGKERKGKKYKDSGQKGKWEGQDCREGRDSLKGKASSLTGLR